MPVDLENIPNSIGYTVGDDIVIYTHDHHSDLNKKLQEWVLTYIATVNCNVHSNSTDSYAQLLGFSTMQYQIELHRIGGKYVWWMKNSTNFDIYDYYFRNDTLTYIVLQISAMYCNDNSLYTKFLQDTGFDLNEPYYVPYYDNYNCQIGSTKVYPYSTIGPALALLVAVFLDTSKWTVYRCNVDIIEGSAKYGVCKIVKLNNRDIGTFRLYGNELYYTSGRTSGFYWNQAVVDAVSPHIYKCSDIAQNVDVDME